MPRRIARKLRKIVERASSPSALINRLRRGSFEPYTRPFRVAGLEGLFLYATWQAEEWYDPIKPYTQLEYEWVADNIDLENKTIVDGGSHHGHYSLFFAMAAKKTGRLISVDPFPMNNTLTRVNLTLNGFEPEIVRCALSDQNGQVRFSNESNGRIVHGKSGVMVEAKRLDAVCDTADVIKLDVEGAEYSILPVALERCPSVSTWIVEVHPMNMPHPDGLVRLFEKHGYDVFYVNRDLNKVEQYRLGTEWRIHSTLFAVR